MNEYSVTVNEVAILTNEYFILAETKEEALALAAKDLDRGSPELVDIQYREPLPEDHIGIEYAKIKQVGFVYDDENIFVPDDEDVVKTVKDKKPTSKEDMATVIQLKKPRRKK